MKNKFFLSPLLFFVFCCFFFLGNSTIHAQKENDSLLYYYHLILTPQSPSDLSKGVEYYTRKKENYLIENDTLQAIQALRMMAIGQSEAGMVYDAQSSAIEALTYLDNFDSNTENIRAAKFGLYNHLGLVYKSIEDYLNAIHMYGNAMKIAVKGKDSIILLNNLGIIYKEQKDFIKAETILTEALKKSKDCEDPRMYARTLNNLGEIQSILKKEEALPNIIEALEIRLAESESQGIYSSYIALSEYYKQEDKQKAIEFAEQAYSLSKNISPIFKVDALKHLLQLQPSEKIEDYIRLTDSISKNKLLQENKFAGIKYNLSEERARTQASELLREKENSAKLRMQLIGGFIIALLLLLGVFIYLQGKRKTKLKVYESEARISKKVHDEVANDVFHIMAKIQTRAPEKLTLLDDLEVIYNKTRDISRDSSPVQLQENFKDQLQDLLQSYQSDETNIMTRNMASVDWLKVSNEKKTTIYRVLQELMTNMKKHSEASVVVLSFAPNKKKIAIIYSDNGVGTDLKSKNGLQHVENRIKAVKASIIFESEPEKGFKAKINI